MTLPRRTARSSASGTTRSSAPSCCPGNDGKPAPVFAGGSNIGISAKSARTTSLSKELLKIIFSAEYQQMLGKNGLGPANSDYVSSPR